MAVDKKISELSFATTPLIGTEVVPIVQSGANVKVTINNLTTGKNVTALGATLTGLTASSAVATDASKNLVSVTNTGTGNNVLGTSPTLITPSLGTPSALVGTNITGTAAGLTAGNVTTNANLTGAITSVGNATSLGSFTSAQLATALTDETGSGSLVFSTSPTLVSPISNNFLAGYTAHDPLSGTFSLTSSSNYYHVITSGGVSSFDINLPNCTTLRIGQSFFIRSLTNNVTVPVKNTSGTIIKNIYANNAALFICTSISTSAGTWEVFYYTDAPTTGDSIIVSSTGGFAIPRITFGSVTLQYISGAGTYNFNLPISAGTSGDILLSGGGSSTAMSWLTPGTGISTFLATPSSANLKSAVTDETGSGALVFATSPTLVTPALGTPSALVGTNITGTASGLTAGSVTTNANLTGAITSVGNATSLGSFTSAQLATALTDETGSGANVFATSPTLVTPALGTPSSGTLTSCTGLPISTGVSGLGTGIATFLATPSSANLASAVTDETGTGALVFANTPTLVTPNIGAATGTSVNLTGNIFAGSSLYAVRTATANSLASGGTLDITVSGAGYVGLLTVYNQSTASGTQRTGSVYFIQGRQTGEGFTQTVLGTGDGSTSGYAITVSNPSNQVIRVTNSGPSTSNLRVVWAGIDAA